MKRFFNAIAGPGLALGISLGMAVSVAVPAHAVSIQEFNGYSSTAKGAGILTSITTEIFRNAYLGRQSHVTCLVENFIPRSGHTNGYNIIVDALNESANPASESVESYIAGTMIKRCNDQTVGAYASLPQQTAAMTALKDFFTLVPNDIDKVEIARMALYTQALRAGGDGHRDYAQCIMSKLYTPTPEGTPTAAFLELFHEIGANRTSTTLTLENLLYASTVYYCGLEPKGSPPPALQADARPSDLTPPPVPR